MIHPKTTLASVNDNIGLGVYSTAFIPSGTIVFIPDKLDVIMKPGSPLPSDPHYKAFIEKYSYIDEHGNRILSCDHAKYMNHSCDSNTMSTAWGFDIAIKDIPPKTEMTCEYGLLNIERDMPCSCGFAECRHVIRPTDINKLAPVWDQKLKAALKGFDKVDQPMAGLLTPDMKRSLMHFLTTGESYTSVRKLKYMPNGIYVKQTG